MTEGLAHLWAGWRGEYIEGVATGGDEARRGCVFCAIFASGLPDDETNIVWVGAEVVAIMNAFPYTSGHLMVMPKRHVGELDQLSPSETTAVWDAVTSAVGALRGAYAPEGINIGINLGRAAGAGVPGHLHVHLVPRWNGDTNFMTAVAETRVLPEALSLSRRKLATHWPVDGA